MSKQSQIFFIATSILLASSLLVGCSSSNNGGNTSKAAVESSKVATGATAVAAAQSLAAPAPTAYTPEPASGVVSTCNIEEFDNSSFQSTPAEAALSVTHSIGGWIAAPQLTAPGFWLRLDDKAKDHYFQVPVVLSVKRPDVISSIKNPAVPLMSGFTMTLPAHAVPVGQYHLYLVAQAGSKTSICDNGRQVGFK